MANIPKDVRKPVSFKDSENVKFCSVDANVLDCEKITDKNKGIVEANNKNKQETMTVDLNKGMVILAKDMDEKTLLIFEKMRESVNVKDKRRKVSKTEDNMLSFEDKVAEKERKKLNFEKEKQRIMKKREDGEQEIS